MAQGFSQSGARRRVRPILAAVVPSRLIFRPEAPQKAEAVLLAAGPAQDCYPLELCTQMLT